ncbi:MAG: NIPSNAP family protein [Alphaproteobacteria bacterium]
MIYDHRTYTCRPGTMPLHLALYARLGFKVQVRHLGQPVVHGFTDVGDVNSFVHIWAYDSAADRTAKRAAMQADPDWQAYLKASNEAGYLVRQENRILVRAPFLDD